MKIKVKEITKGCKFEIIKDGEWIDLRAAEAVDLKAPHIKLNGKVVFDTAYIPLGIAMKLPEGFEAHVLPRSSTPKKFGIMCANSQGIIDFTYSGNNDEWKFPAIAIRKTHINKGDRICQFRIVLSQKATARQKEFWLKSNFIEFEWVDKLEGPNRGGFGSTGVK